MMKRLGFLETKRTPRYSMRKLNVGMASVLLGVTIFGINFTNHSVKAATIATEKVQQGSASKNATANNSKEAATTPQSSPETQGSADTDINSSAAKLAATVDQNNTNTQKATSATEKVRQGSASKNATANNSTEAATTSQSAPETQGSADTDIRSLTAISAAKLATMNLMQTNGINGTGKDRSAAATVTPDNINDQPAKENQKLANEHNLTSSDNSSSNIYKGTDGKYYKIVTIYANDYVYHTADIQANSTDTTAEDTKNNINISKEDLGNGKTRWTVTFFPKKGLQNVGSRLSGLSSAKFGIALTNDYQILGNVDMDVISDPKQTFSTYIFKPGSNRATETTVQNPPAEVKFSFNPKTDVDENTGLINSKTMPAYNNKYLQGPYYFTTATDIGKENLWQTYFKKWSLFGTVSNNAYDGSPYLGTDHQLYFNSSKIKNKTGVDGAKEGNPVIYDTRDGVNGVFNSVNFNQAMEFKSQGVTDQAQFSSYKISFTTQHTDSHEVDLAPGSKNQQFSGISANIYSYQNGGWNGFSRLYGEQRALNPAGVVKQANEVVSGWGPAKEALGQIKQDYLNNAQINVLRNKILNNITDSDAVNNIIKEGNSLNDAMKNLGNSIGQYDPDGSFAEHKEDTTKASARYKYADPDKKEAYDNATEATKALINKDTGAYADQTTVETLTEAENKAWNELKVVLANKITPKVPAKEPVADTSSLTETEKANVQKNVEDANKGNFPDGTTVTVGDDGTATINYKDNSSETIPGSDLVRPATDAEKTKPKVPETKEPVANTSSLTETEKANVQKNVEDANKGNFPDGTTVTVGDDGTATINYKDNSSETIPGSDLVRPATDAEKTKPKVPETKEPVANTSSLTETEKANVQKNVEDANKGNFPDGTTVTVGDDGTATINYKDNSSETIPGSDLVRPATDAEKTKPKVPETKEPVANTSSLTETEKANVQKNVEDANKGNFPDGTTVTVGDDGTATVNYPDGSKDTIPGDQLVQGQKGDTTDAGNITPTVPGGKVTVKDPSHLTDDEKKQVKNNVDNANKDKFPAGTTVTVGDDGTATVTYPDGSKDTIPGDQLVQGQKGDTTDAGNITPTVPGDKVTVKDPSHLTDDEKKQVKNNVDNANKDKFPAGTTVTVGDDGTATVNYPDGSKDTIPGDQLVQGQKGSTTDAGNITPTVPGDKVTVKDPSHLTDDEKNQVKNNVDNANKDKFPAGTTVTVGDDGTATVTYPDGSKDTIPGDQLVQGQKGSTTDAGNITPTVPGDKVTVKDPSHLTDDEKNQVKNNVDNANKDKFPAGTTVTVGDDGTTTVTYPDGSKDVISGTDLVIAAKSEDVLGSKYHSHKNGSNSSQADRVKGASTANGSIANAGNNLGVKGESDNAIGNNKATSLKTLPQTGTKDTSILGVLGMLLASLGLFGFKKKRDKE
ncbi:LEA family epithelial adhesin [Lactobacillus johnsonii]|uniref:Secreted protein n=1 Tax=Lactobacillus johnsonii (strain FI9785) TaxID=633699 RepID=D0R2R6_LACJF|nr:putative secreted protein [Lactobacillus johnsonii FI9785]